MQHIVRIHWKDKIVEKPVESGTNLLKFLQTNSIEISSPCGGQGTCGKCRINVSGLTEEPSDNERKLLSGKALEKGYRLACCNNINADLDIFLTGSAETAAKIATEAKQRHLKLKPLICKKSVSLPMPDIQDQRPDDDRLSSALKKQKFGNDIDLLRELPTVLRQENFKVTLVSTGKRLIAVEPGDTTGKIYGIAFDIGTTTVVGYLMDLVTGEKLGVHSMLNPQNKFGADVLSRISYASESQAAFREMNKTINKCISSIIRVLCSENGICRNDIYGLVVVGNTTMLHFLMRIPAVNIGTSPFIPVTTGLHKIKASKLGININRHGYCVIYPSVSAYVGADTVAAVLSSGMYERDRISLLVDIGTNGEIVLGNDKWMYSCSAAAGPAFEGAHIRNGVGGISGAIDKVKITPEFSYNTIGDEKPIGICGSGIVDAVSEMLRAGIIDETGRLFQKDEADSSLSRDLRDRLICIDGLNSFLLVEGKDVDEEIDITVTQKDIRELQNAKAAIAAAIKILINRAGINVEDIDKVYLAGGFGSYINIESALNIGLLPKELNGRIESIGNAAGAGAIEGLLSVDMIDESEKIKEKIKYIELSSCTEFMNEYAECMMFE